MSAYGPHNPVPREVLQRIRDLLKAGAFTDIAIAAECGVSTPVVRRQALLLDALGVDVKRDSNAIAAVERAERGVDGVASVKRSATQGGDYDEAGVDLVDVFAMPRTPKQIKRFYRGDE